MTLTALMESEEFSDIYNLPVFVVTTNTPLVRKDIRAKLIFGLYKVLLIGKIKK